jgi:hypothetical protein
VDRTERLQNAMKSLKRHRLKATIEFYRDRTGQRICWRPTQES